MNSLFFKTATPSFRDRDLVVVLTLPLFATQLDSQHSAPRVSRCPTIGSKSKKIMSRDVGRHATSPSATPSRAVLLLICRHPKHHHTNLSVASAGRRHGKGSECTEPELANPPNKLRSGWAQRSSAQKTQGSCAQLMLPSAVVMLSMPPLNSSPEGQKASMGCLFRTVRESPSAVPPASTQFNSLRHVHTWVLQGLYCHWFGHYLRKCNRPVATARTRRLNTHHNVPAAAYSSGLPEPDQARFSTVVVVC